LQALAVAGDLPRLSLPPVPSNGIQPVETAIAEVAIRQVLSSAPPARERVLQPQALGAAPVDRVVRVAAQSINRLMGLAGESLIESRRIRGLSLGMQRLKRRQSAMVDLCDALAREVAAHPNARLQALLAEAKERSVESHAAVVEELHQLDSYAQRVDDLSDRLYREALKSRMRPFGDCVHGFPRLVRDIARQLGKQVRLQIAGESTDVDRDVLESLDAPLNHLLRNSLDHGIESPAERLAAGKPALATVRLEARHHAGMLAITVSDDGRGIEPEKLRSKVIERGLATPGMAAALSTGELLEFIFLPGFSTAQGVTQISGRGVGLDAVRTAVQAASGVVQVRTNPGVGTSFHLKLPVTRSVMRAVVAKVAGEGYAFPLLAIERVLRVEQSALRTVGTARYFVLEGANIALVSAEQVLGLQSSATAPEQLCVVIIGNETHRYGVIVDEFLGEHDLVVRPLDTRLGKVQDIAAAAILRDGSPALIFDVDDLIRSIEKLAQAGRVEQLSGPAVATLARAKKRILVVDDSITVREAERQLLVNHGYEVDVAVDGVDGWNSVQRARYDLVISDIDMPRMNGIDLVRTIKQDPQHNAIPIVIVSYKDREEDRMRGLDAGANYYLTKSSFHDESLVQAVENLIGEAAA
jgi:two-component system sensor histidine kinase and response regulator WspE